MRRQNLQNLKNSSCNRTWLIPNSYITPEKDYFSKCKYLNPYYPAVRHTLRCLTSEDKSSRSCATFPWSFIHLVRSPAAVTSTSHLHSIKLAGKCCIGITEGHGSARAINNAVFPSLSFGSLLSSSPDSTSPQTVNGPTVETAIGMKGWRSVMERTLVIRPASHIFLGRFLFIYLQVNVKYIYIHIL